MDLNLLSTRTLDHQQLEAVPVLLSTVFLHIIAIPISHRITRVIRKEPTLSLRLDPIHLVITRLII